MFSHLVIVELLLMRVGIQDSLKPFAIIVRPSRPLLVELDVAFDLRLSSSLVILLVEVSLSLLQIFLGDVPWFFYLGGVEKTNRGGISSVDDGVIPRGFGLSHLNLLRFFVGQKGSASHGLYLILHGFLKRRRTGPHPQLIVIMQKWTFLTNLVLYQHFLSIFLAFGE